MKLKIAVNATALLTPTTGIGRYTYNLFSEIVKRNECDIEFLYGLSWDKKLTVPDNQHTNFTRVVKKVFPYVRSIRRLAQKSILECKANKEKFDLYHEPNFLALSFVLPVIATIHDLSVVKYPEYHPVDRVKIFEKHLHRTIEQSEYLIADSEFVRREVISVFGVDPEKVVTTLLGVGKSFYPRGYESARQYLDGCNLKYKSFFLVVSTLEPRKNFKLVIDAYMKLDNGVKNQYPLVIVGMNGWEMSQFDRDIEKLKRQGHLRMLGYVTDETLAMLYSSAKSFIYPSVYEGFGLPPLEAMACGAPVITSNTSSLPEVIGDAGIMVKPSDVQALSEIMLQLVEDSNMVVSMSSKSIDRAKLFTWEKCADQTMAVYHRI